MCGIVGIVTGRSQNVAAALYDSLIHLQHRGQDAAGILTSDKRFYSHQGAGLVRELFNDKDVHALKGNMGIAHTRYPTAGGNKASDSQPIWVGSPRGIALAHNGNLSNYDELADVFRRNHGHLDTALDSEIILHLFADELDKTATFNESDELFFDHLCTVVSKIFARIKGAYSIVSIILGKGMVVFRDPHGIRPLVWGKRENAENSTDYIFASETTPFYALNFEDQGSVHPGEIIFISMDGLMFRQILTRQNQHPCVFEFIYFARPDARIDGISVYRSRLYMGQNLGKQWQRKYPLLRPDVVIPVPFTANTAALSLAHTLNVPYSEGLYKNPFIGRTFIMPNQKARTQNIRYKLTPQETEIKDKTVLLVDDSIVRGSTAREIVKMVREIGARQVYLASTAPPIKYPCFYGIDIPSQAELIAAQKEEDTIREELGVDVLMYQQEDDLVEAVLRQEEGQIKKPCLSCMDGKYFCQTITPKKIRQLAEKRVSEKAMEHELAEV